MREILAQLAELVEFLHLLKIGLITSGGKQRIKLVGLRLLSPDSGSFSPYAQKWKSPQVDLKTVAAHNSDTISWMSEDFQ